MKFELYYIIQDAPRVFVEEFEGDDLVSCLRFSDYSEIIYIMEEFKKGVWFCEDDLGAYLIREIH